MIVCRLLFFVGSWMLVGCSVMLVDFVGCYLFVVCCLLLLIVGCWMLVVGCGCLFVGWLVVICRL